MLFDSRFAYTLLLWLLLPYAFFHLWWRSRKQREYLDHIGERFGRYQISCDKPVIWLHSVSVGETAPLQPVVRNLRESYPDHQILLTHTTPTGRDASEQLFGEDVVRVYLPYDILLQCNFFGPLPPHCRCAAGNRNLVQPDSRLPCRSRYLCCC